MIKKLTLLSVTVLFFAYSAISQVYHGVNASRKIENTNTLWINETNSSIKYIKFVHPEQVSKSSHSAWLKKLLNAPANVDFQLIRTTTDKIGQTHYRYAQYVSGFKIDGAQYIIHSSQGEILSANGEYYSVQNLPSGASITEEYAFKLAKFNVPSEQYLWEADNASRPEGELVIAGNLKNLRLAFKFDIYSVEPLGRYFVFVDAQNGEIIQRDDRIHHTSVTGTAHTKYHGIQSITTDSVSATNYVLLDAGRSITTKDLNNGTSYGSAVHFTDANNIWTSTANQDDAALDAHWGAGKTYDYFYLTYGLDSYDGLGASINSFVHFGTNYVNAFWDGTRMTYGDGNGTSYSALTSLDVVGHEITHAVTQNSANLVYSYESGALNESFSDVFGVAIDFYADPSNANWYMGDLFHITGNGFRDMSNPNNKSHPDTYLGTYWHTGSSDNGGVHTNSGVQNFWFYLLSVGGTGVNDNSASYTVSAQGITDAGAIAYRNLSVYLTTNSQYSDARFYAIQSAVDLFGSCSTQEIATTDAWYAVGIGTNYSNSVSSNFTASQTYFCTIPASVSFTNQSVNDSARIWDFGDSSTDTAFAPTHSYTTAGTYTVTLTTFGSSSCGAMNDTLVLTNYITVTNTGGPITPTCVPTAITGSASYGVFNFSLNTINNTTSGGSDGYQDYTCSQSTTVTEGDILSMSVGVGSLTQNVKVYIDYNNNGSFASSEMVYTGISNGIHTSNISIPAVTANNTPLRIRVIADYYTITSTCTTSVNNSQIEDYSVIIAPLTSAPVADFVANPTVLNTGASTVFTNLSSGLPTSYSWSFPGGTPSTSSATNPTITYATNGTYDAQLIATNAFGSDTILKTNYISVSNQVNMCGAITSTNSVTGLLYDNGGPTGNYSNSKNCYFLIQPSCADSITLMFSQFSTENGYDYVRVYDGTSTSATQILYASGSGLPSAVTATSGSMYIWFHSDGSITSSGFAASWATVQSSAIPPVAAFTASDFNPPLGGTVAFTDLSLNSPISWDWNLGNGSTSTLQNPSSTYNSSGAHTVELVAHTCGFADTASSIVTVQGLPIISVNPTSISHTFNSCVDSITIPITIYNTGGGDLVLDTVVAGSGTDSLSSTITYVVSGASTSHLFTGLPTGIDTLHVAITLAGDYDSSGEYATFSIDGYNYGIIPDDNTPLFTYNIDIFGANLTSFLVDGNLNFVVQNTGSVNVFSGWGNYHKIDISYSSSSLFIYPSPVNDTVSIGDSTTIYVTLSAVGLPIGTYTDSIAIYSNDSVNNPLYIPITIINNGTAYLDVDSSCIAFDTVLQFLNDSAMLTISNPGCDTLTISSMATATSDYTLSSSAMVIPPFSTDSIWVYFNSTSLGWHYDTVTITTSANDTTVCLSGFIEGSPIISTQPDTLNVTINSCNDSVVVPMWVYNTGSADLVFNTNGSGSGNGSMNVVAWKYAVDLSTGPNGEYQNTINAINTNFTNYNLIETSTTDSVVMQGLLANATVLLIPEQEFSVGSVNQWMSNTIKTFVSNGGWLVRLGVSDPYKINDIGILATSYTGSYNSGNQTIVDPTSMLLNNVALPVVNTNAVYPKYISTPGFNVVTSYSGITVLGDLDYGSGKVIWIAYDYYQLNASNQRIVANAIEWASTTAVAGSNWVYSNPDSGLVVPGDSMLIYVTVNGSGFASGSYQGVLNFSSNDPVNPVWVVPVNLTINGAPEIAFSDSCVLFDSVMQFTSDTSGIWVLNPGCDSLLVTNITSSSNDVTFDTTALTIPPFDSLYLEAYFMPDTAQAYSGTITFFNNAGDSTICFTGYATGAPIISINPDSIYVTINSCDDSLIIPVTIYNTGLSDLDVTNIYSNGSGVGSGSGSPVGTPSVALFRDGIAWGGNGNVTNLQALGYNYTIFPSSQMATAYIDSFDLILFESVQGSNFYGNYMANVTKFETYVSNGGSIQYNMASSYPTHILPGGVVAINLNLGNYVDNISDTTHPMFSGCGLTTITGNYASHGSVTNIPVNATTLTTNSAGAATTIEYGFGAGHVMVTVLTLEHMYSNNFGCSSLIENALQYNSGASSLIWLFSMSDSAYVIPADSQIINIVVKSTGLQNGLYTGNIVFESNDPVNPVINLPVVLNVNGQANMVFSDSCLVFDTTLQFTTDTMQVWVNNPGCDTLNISNIVSSNADITFSSSSMNLPPNDSVLLTVYFTPDTLQVYTGQITFYSNIGDSTICFNGAVLGAPHIVVNPDSIFVTLGCNDSIIVPVTISNTGTGPLSFNINNTQGSGVPGSVNVFAWTNGVDMVTEYPNTIAAINAYNSNYTLVQNATSSPSVLATYLSTADVLLLPEQETGSSVINSSMTSVILSFVNNGGWVIFCGNTDIKINSYGILTTTGGGNVSSGTQVILNASSDLLTNVSQPIYNTNATFYKTILNTGFNTVTSYGGKTVVGEMNLGLGKVIYLGFDYFSYNSGTQKIIANAVSWASSNIAQWTYATPDTGYVVAGDSTIIDIIINSDSLSPGTYQATYTINSNDPSNPLVTIPVVLVVSGTPELWVSDSCVNVGTVNQFATFTDSFEIANIGCDTMTITSVTTSNLWVTASASSTTIVDGDSADVVFTISPSNIGAFTEFITVNTNGNDSTVCVMGTVMASSIISVSPIPSTSIRLCDPVLTTSFYVKNVGLGNLTWSYVMVVGGPALSPLSGTVVPGDSTLVTVTINNPLVVGSYVWNITLNSNAPQTPSLTIPIYYTITNEPCVDYNYNIISACDGVVGFTDLTTGNVLSYFWDFDDGNTSTNQNPIHNYTSSGTYNVQFVVCGPTTCDTLSQSIVVTSTNLVIPASCYPSTTTATVSTGILNVNLSTLNSVTTNSTEGYQDFSCSMGAQLTVNTPQTINVTVVNNTNQTVKAWIDYNNDGFFGGNELIMLSAGWGSLSGMFTPPVTAILNVKVRMRIKVELATTANTGACDIPVNGQVEDYYIEILPDNNPPVAQYAGDVNNDCSGIVTFTDQSQQNPTSWFWDFGDGSSSNIQNPIHQYASDGIYNVKLVATNAFGADSLTQNVLVDKYDIGIAYSGLLNANQTLNFSQTGGPSVTWSWNFGDGNTSNFSNPNNTYSQSGTYYVSLTCSNDQGCQTTFLDTLVIDSPVGINEVDNSFEVSLHPNPNNGNFTFNYNGQGSELNIVIMSTNGQTIFTKEYKVNGKLKVNFNDLNLAAGVYFLNVEDGEYKESLRFVVR